MTIAECSKKFDQILTPELFQDSSMNTLQVEGSTGEVTKIAFGVDASLALFKQAAQLGANMVVVHHGLFWGAPLAVVGDHKERIAFLLEKGISLYASHLPLDAHPTVGNNAVMADLIGLQQREPLSVGWIGDLEAPLTIEEIQKRIGVNLRNGGTLLPFGPEKLQRVAIVSGGGGFALDQAIAQGAEALITGEFEHQRYHKALENRITLLGGGHYYTETFGVKALANICTKEWGVESCFIDLPTNL